ncbi:hypothetical protein AURDEDRAFT_125888 [Auricularia subglabra TFB-10046 SS5]|nr:hypothetical protein AURDEDRAFT_125888 [Auricularia subglabra TFB-10046 SS5]
MTRSVQSALKACRKPGAWPTNKRVVCAARPTLAGRRKRRHREYAREIDSDAPQLHPHRNSARQSSAGPQRGHGQRCRTAHPVRCKHCVRESLDIGPGVVFNSQSSRSRRTISKSVTEGLTADGRSGVINAVLSGSEHTWGAPARPGSSQLRQGPSPSHAPLLDPTG